MKKTVFIILTLAAVFSLQTESFAMIAPRSAVLMDEIHPQTSCIFKSKINTVEKHKKLLLTASERKAPQPVYCPEANLTVVDSKQVKVKYDFWIVKVLKELFD